MAENTKTYVVDASFILGALLPDELTISAHDIIVQHAQGIVKLISSEIFPYEVFNALRMAVIRKRITQSQATRITKDFLLLEIQTQPLNFSKLFLLAQRYNLTVYDASYLFLARKQKISLLTTDKKLQELA